MKYLELLQRITHLKEIGALLEVQDPYPLNPTIRWGNGLPVHQKLADLFDARVADYLPTIEAIGKYEDYFRKIAKTEPDSPVEPYWVNGWLPSMDGISIYTLLAENKPRRFIEIGSGNSTKFAARAIRDHNLETKIFSIDPRPRAEIDQLCHRIIRSPLESTEIKFFESVKSDDIVFIDCSHRAMQNSDVTVFFLEVLPLLPCGCKIGIHDICLPCDYPSGWEHRYYNEQYMLATLLLYGADKFKLILPTAYACLSGKYLPALQGLESYLGSMDVPFGGSIFWMQKKNN